MATESPSPAPEPVPLPEEPVEKIPVFTGLPENEKKERVPKRVKKPISRRDRRRWRRLNRTMQDKATRATWRAVIIALIPLLGVIVTGVLYWQEQPKMTLLISAGATVGLFLITAPFVLWGTVSALRRGTRRIILSVLLGFYSGTLTFALIVGLVAAAIGWGLITGQPLPVIDQKVELPGDIR